VFGAVISLGRPDGATVSLRHFRQAIRGSDGVFAGAVHALFPQDAPPGVPLAVPSDTTHFHGLISRDPSMFRVFDVIRNVAATDVTVLVRGESGTGKELVARAIHDESHRARRPFVAVNCASFSPGLLESELFGHTKGAFSGAIADRVGIFAQADGGTLFLDEVAEMPLDLQSKLLRVLQERVVVPVGGTRPQKVDVRVIAATHRSLREEVRAGRFREDLMYRLRVVPLFLPPLRERSIDIELLLRHVIDEHNRGGPRQIGRIAPDAMRALLSHRWPGNIRELRNVVDHAFAMGRGPELRLDELPPEFTEAAAAKPRWRGPDEASAIREALEAHQGDLSAAAAALGMGRTTLWRKRRQLGLG
jgi:two-component system response regulator AtoC